MSGGTYRLVTRSDFDGLVCALLFKELGMIDDIKFVHPKDMQDGTILISSSDITTNLPFVNGVHLAFDHHVSETERLDRLPDNYIIDPDAPSASRVVYNYYGGDERFGMVNADMMAAVDKSDSGQFDREDILHPQGWVLLNYIMDARTGLGRFKDFRVSNYQLMMELIDACRDHPIEDILAMPDVKERVDLYFAHDRLAREQIARCITVDGNLAILDLRDEETIFTTNRFRIYALHPDSTISVHVVWGLHQLNTVFAVGKSVLNRTSEINIGNLLLTYDGGGHANAGTCQVDNDDAERVLHDLRGLLRDPA